MAVTLTSAEARVLGVLIEKSLALPEYYPMTINAVVTACNQKNNRDPVTCYTEADVATALHGLTRWQLASQAPPERNSRVNRFRHEAEKRFGWAAPQRAIMAELLLRGPQTVGELRTNASRMFKLEALDYVNQLLTELQTCDPPFVSVLPRQPGQSAIRFAQLLCQDAAAPATLEQEAPAAGAAPIAPPAIDASSLSSRVSHLEAHVTQLQSEIAELRRRLDAVAENANP